MSIFIKNINIFLKKGLHISSVVRRMRHTSIRRVVSSAGRASALQAEGQRFDPVTTHHIAAVVQLVRMPACHAGGHGFEPRPLRHEEKASN